jgi:hypothetical protein
MALPTLNPSVIGGGDPRRTYLSTNDIMSEVTGAPPMGQPPAQSGQYAPLTPPAPLVQEQARGASVETPLAPLATKTTEPYKNKYDQIYDEAEQLLSKSLEQKQPFSNMGLALSRGFFRPTKTGSFFESLGNVAEEVGKSQDQEARENVTNLQARMALARQGSERQREKDIESTMAGLYEKTPTGTLKMNPEMAMKLASITKDPKFLQQLIAEQKQEALSTVGNQLITTTQVTKPDGTVEAKFKINPAKFGDYVKLTGDPLGASEKLADAIKKMRASGMISDMGDASNPFESLKLTAELLGKGGESYTKLIDHYSKIAPSMDPETAAKKAGDLLQQMNQHLDRNTQMANTMMIATSNQAMAQAQRDFGNQIKQSELDRKLEEAKDKKDLKEEAKLNALKDQANKLKELSFTAESLRNHPGRGSGTAPFVGSVLSVIPKTDARDFSNQLESLKSATFMASIQNMKGLGALSNAEGSRVMNLITKLDPQGSKKAFDGSLDMIDRYVKNGIENVNRQARGERPVFLEPDEIGKPTPSAQPSTASQSGGFKIIDVQKAK